MFGKSLLSFASRVGLLAVWVVLALPAPPARAGDVETARKNLDSAKEKLKDQNWNGLDEDMRSVEEFLEGVPEAEKAPVLKELGELRQKAEPQIKAFKAKAIVDRATRELDLAANEVTTVPEDSANVLKETSERLNSDEAKKNVDAETLKKLQGRLAGIQQMAGSRLKKRAMESVAPLMKELEEKVAADPFKGKDQSEADSVGQELDGLTKRIRGMISELPKDDADVKAINAKLAAVDKKIEMAAGASERAEAIQNLSSSWKSAQKEFAGWDKETEGPKWDHFTKTSSQEMSQMLMPKTAEAVTRVQYWLDQDQVKEAQAKYGSDPALKALMDEAKKTLDAAAGKLNKVYNGLLDEAEKLPTPQDSLVLDKPESMARDAERWFDGTKFKGPNVARAKKLNEKWQSAVAGASQAAEELYKKMVAEATANWPKVEASVKAEEGFNPAEADRWKGKTIRLKGVYNRSGWDFDGAYDFAMKINGMPVAGNYAANVKAAFADAQHKTKKDIDDHEPWDVIAVVQGPGKIQERASADVRASGETIGRIEGHRPVDCTVVKIIALHAGPVAIGPGGAGAPGVASGPGEPVLASAKVGPDAAPTPATPGTPAPVATATPGTGWGLRILWALLGLTAAAAAFVKARPELVTALSGGGDAGSAPANPAARMLSGDMLGYAGLAFAALGVVWLIATRFIYDLLPALAMIAAGLYAAGDFLRARGVLSETSYAKVKGLGVPIAAAAAGLAIVHLVIGGWMLF